MRRQHPKKVTAPDVPTSSSNDVLVETKMLVKSVSGMKLGEQVEAMEVVSPELLSEPAVPTLVTDQPMETSDIPDSDVILCEHVLENREWGATPFTLRSPPLLSKPPHQPKCPN